MYTELDVVGTSDRSLLLVAVLVAFVAGETRRARAARLVTSEA